jgi:hypothetical protein
MTSVTPPAEDPPAVKRPKVALASATRLRADRAEGFTCVCAALTRLLRDVPRRGGEHREAVAAESTRTVKVGPAPLRASGSPARDADHRPALHPARVGAAVKLSVRLTQASGS